MKEITVKILVVMTGALLIGCDIAGPAHPERDGRSYLENHGHSTPFVDRVVNEDKLDHTEVTNLSKCSSADVRFLVARNPNLTHDEIDIFVRDENDFVRSGAAWNTNLSPDQIDILTDDPSHTVYCGLARNAALSDEALLRIHKKRNPGLVWFALNPNCPDAIRQEIENSHDNDAKHWLQIMDGWKREGIYRQYDNGRWYKPLTSKQ